VGLKPLLELLLPDDSLGLNRTSVGLKLRTYLTMPLGLLLPQSNQRGIETELDAPGFNDVGSLNRTSVGLKLSQNQGGLSIPYPPQSNQRGIETHFKYFLRTATNAPQSNQRGIETFPET